MTQDTINTNVWYPAEGKFFRRISDHRIVKGPLTLKEVKFINGVRLYIPKLEVIEDYEEIDDSVILAELLRCEEIKKEKLANYKAKKIEELAAYDSSSTVNKFFINDLQLWLSRDERLVITNSLNICKLVGQSSYTTWFNVQGVEVSFDIPVEKGLSILTTVELYAMDCYNNTAKHKAAIQKLETKEEVLNYDFTTGYPEALKFQL